MDDMNDSFIPDLLVNSYINLGGTGGGSGAISGKYRFNISGEMQTFLTLICSLAITLEIFPPPLTRFM
ncbi:hypothetical protein [Burkholderia sp. BCC0397]|uniref:hypothetical protein n=1 Tax=Burkholderia sp. BCC0397 TaxID=486876 RepID=UPI0015884E2A|nr:hypothetical protein [Burkholderia sp. BCC0397]